MKIFRVICSVLVILTTSLCIVTAAQNITLRTSDIYLFYFNDSGAVDRIYTDLTNSEMADGIAGFMNSFRPKEFQIYEDTGYDMQGIFESEESDSMMLVKKWLDISLIVCLVSLILTAAIWFWLLREGYKKLLRGRTYISIALSGVLIAGSFIFVSTHNGRLWLADQIGLVIPEETTTLTILLGNDFISMADTFYVIIALILLAVSTYVLLRLTRLPRIFY